MFKKHGSIIALGLLMLTIFSIEANAKMCKTKTADGQDAFLWATNSKGELMITKSASGIIATMAECPVREVIVTTEKIVEVEVQKPYEVPNPRNKCEEVAVKSCDPDFGGMPLCTTNNFENFCGFCFVATGNKVERYINGSPYDGTKINQGVAACPNTQNE